MRTREQERMALALKKVGEMAKHEAKADYGRACHTFAPLVRSAGLCQALAFFATRKGGHEVYLRHIEEHLREGCFVPTGKSLAAIAGEADLTHYILLTREALACALWHKRLAQSELGIDSTGEEG